MDPYRMFTGTVADNGDNTILAYEYLAEAVRSVKTEKDKLFKTHLQELVEANIQDPNLDVDFLCNRLLISRTKLYQKIKDISNLSVGDFIKSIRLKKAIYLMTHEDISLTDVAYRIGLQSPSYFSRVFKKEFNKSPMQFMQALKHQLNRQSNG